MIVLGANSDDTGTQLERLTRIILENRGYSNLAVNVITSGGQEIDVTAEYAVPVPGDPQTRRLIAECKAYQNPVAMPDWLKFLGKVFVEETRLNQEVTGLFVALSGVNGNVHGSYDEMRQHRSNISLLAGDSLLSEVGSRYSLAPRSEVIRGLRTLTARQYLQVEPAYYNEAVFWIFTFSSSQYAILTGSGELASPERVAELSPLVESRLSVSDPVDLLAEAEAQTQLNQLKKDIVAQIAADGGSLAMDDLKAMRDEHGTLLDKALQDLMNADWMSSTDGALAFCHSDPAQSEHYSQLTSILRFMFDGPLSSATMRLFFRSDYVQARLNDQYLKHVSTVQGDLPVTSELGETILKIVKVSPSACLQSVTPEPLIVTHRTKQKTLYDSDEDDRRTLKRQLLTCLARDFDQSALKEYFYEACDLREIETLQEITVKSQTGAEISESVRVRRAIGKAHESIGGGYIQILLLDHAPQPWEKGGLGQADAERE